MSSSPSSVDFAQLTPVAPPAPAPSRESAARQARGLVAAAEAEAQRIRSDAFAAGHAEGFAAGRSEAGSELAPAAAALADAARQLNMLQSEAADRVEPEAVELAVRMAEKVVAGALDVEPGRLLDVVRGALRTIVERERVVVLVHPDDLDLLRDGVAEVTGSLGGIEHLEVQEERRVARGGAILRTSFGEVDARIETKLARARDAVIEGLSQS
jgi:flagellar biosynthesis/type III secretory pathway protein FliH